MGADMSATVLVIEDTPANMKLAVMLLDKAGYRVLQAANAIQGIELARRYLPDLVIMDMQLPIMDGVEAAKLLKADPATEHIKIIALTALAMKGDEDRMRQAGCDGYIAKPIHYQHFLDEIKRMLATSTGDEGYAHDRQANHPDRR